MKPATLSGRLLTWAITTLVVLWAAFAAVGYLTGAEEAIELSDSHLAAVAQVTLGDPPQAPHAEEFPTSLTVVVWDADGRLLQHRGPAPVPAFDQREGHFDLDLGTPPTRWRVFSRWSADTPRRKVTVLGDAGLRDALALDVAGDIAEPGLWLLPVAVLVLGLVVRRGLKPLRELSEEVHALDVRRPEPLRAGRGHAELRAVADAIDTLGERYRAALDRERQLASEFAHELRTPLTSIALQANALRQPSAPEERATALHRLEQDALRAGEVLTALLALARASRAELGEAAQPVELAELARGVVGEFAQAALDSGHTLEFEADAPLKIEGHPVLLEMALRNLIDNAIGHTARGTRIEVRLDAAQRWLQVSDDGRATTPDPTRHLGLGLGHRVIDKVASVHRAAFGPADPPAGFVRSYRLSWPLRP